MPINFPDSPAVDQTFTSGNRSWKWAGTRWEAISNAVQGYGVASEEISANTTLVAQTKYFVNTAQALSLTLPATPTVGDEVFIYDAAGEADINNITVLRNGTKINGLLEDAIIDVAQSTSSFTYTGPTIGWRFD